MQCISYRKNERIARHRSIYARMARVRASPRCYHGLACRPLDRSAKADRRKRGDEFVAMRSALARARQPATSRRATERARNRQACAHFAGPPGVPRRPTAPRSPLSHCRPGPRGAKPNSLVASEPSRADRIDARLQRDSTVSSRGAKVNATLGRTWRGGSTGGCHGFGEAHRPTSLSKPLRCLNPCPVVRFSRAQPVVRALGLYQPSISQPSMAYAIACFPVYSRPHVLGDPSLN